MFSTVPFGTQTGRNGTGQDGTEQNEMEVRVMFESEMDPNHLNQDHNPLPGIAHLLATSDDELSFESGRVPDQIHLVYTDGDDKIQVMFVTSDGAGEEEGLLW
ncbi:hypothetical protein EV2_033943 [Malus domestica]